MWCVKAGIRVAEPTTQNGFDLETSVRGHAADGTKTSDVLVEEGDDGTFAVMVERPRAVLDQALPVLPDGRGASLDHVQP